MGFAMLFGWVVTVVASLAAAIVGILATRTLAKRTNVAAGRAPVAAAATMLATSLVEGLFVSMEFRIASTHQDGLPRILGLAFASSALLVWLMPALTRTPGRRSFPAVCWAGLAIFTLTPFVTWAALVSIPEGLERSRSLVRSEYREASFENDHARAARLLERHRWLREELAHEHDGTVPLD